ncbi:Chalcone isomerase [Dillenia turbinata]|uniref:Chalcone-flavonone isomerase family protein n=1 Tax=Dillenia turbinata TaxID=194707 RepID=A0AAN8VH23_9MAGN
MTPLPSPSVNGIQVESYFFPPAVKPPGSNKTLFLGGAGARGLEIQGKFIKFTTIGVYLEETALPSLSVKWKGKSAEVLTESVEFFRDIVTVVNTIAPVIHDGQYMEIAFFFYQEEVTASGIESGIPSKDANNLTLKATISKAYFSKMVAGPFEKFIRVTVILPLTGQQYSEKVTENCVAFWKSIGSYTDAEAKAVEKFTEVFKDETFPPGASILFTQSPLGSLTIGFSKDDSIPEAVTAVIENKQLSEAILESIIGKHGVSPEAKQSLAARVSKLLAETGEKPIEGEAGKE